MKINPLAVPLAFAYAAALAKNGVPFDEAMRARVAVMISGPGFTAFGVRRPPGARIDDAKFVRDVLTAMDMFNSLDPLVQESITSRFTGILTEGMVELEGTATLLGEEPEAPPLWFPQPTAMA